ncbi:MAG: cupin domain-containing protein [Bryobacteraceae bacterium]
MSYSRRELGILPFLAAAAAKASETLPSQAHPFDSLPVQASGENRMRQVFNGETHTGMQLEMHMTELPPGGAPHPPHRHAHEEMILVHQGTMEVTISGKSTRLGPGSSAYVASNEMHGWHNVGTGRALYWVIAIGSDKA